MEIALLVALLVTNGVWLYFFDRMQKRSENERWALQERIREPNALVPPPTFVEKVEPEITAVEPPEDEFDLVGAVDPVLNRED